MVYWSEAAQGGIAAFEQPELFVAELRKSVRSDVLTTGTRKGAEHE